MANDPILLSCFDSFAPVRDGAAGRLDDGAQPGPFDRLAWFEALHRHACPDAAPRILHARGLHAQGGAAQGWLFLAQRPGGRLDGIANWYSFTFRPQFDGAPDRATRLALLTAMAGRLRGMSHHLRFYPIVDDEQADCALITEGLRAAGWSVIPRIMARKRLLRLAPGTRFEDYWAARPGTLRSTFRRKAQRHPLAINIHRDIDDALWAALEAVFAASWKPRGDDFAFLRDFAEREAAAGRLRLGLGRIDGRPAAVELWTVEGDRAYIHKLAFDERFAARSPGTQLSHAMFAQAIDGDGARLIDFGTGDNDYKAAWMPEAVPMRQIDAFDLRRPASWRAALAARLSAVSQPGEGGWRASRGTGGRRAALTAADRP